MLYIRIPTGGQNIHTIRDAGEKGRHETIEKLYVEDAH